jgi:hypothetical protein
VSCAGWEFTPNQHKTRGALSWSPTRNIARCTDNITWNNWRYGSNDSTKSPASGIATVSEPYWCHQWGECAKSCVRRSVCFCSKSGGGAGILVGPFIPLGHSPGTRWSELPTLRCSSKWGRGGGGEVETWPLIHGGCCHVTEVGGPYGLWESRFRLSGKMAGTLWNYARYTLT